MSNGRFDLEAWEILPGAIHLPGVPVPLYLGDSADPGRRRIGEAEIHEAPDGSIVISGRIDDERVRAGLGGVGLSVSVEREVWADWVCSTCRSRLVTISGRWHHFTGAQPHEPVPVWSETGR